MAMPENAPLTKTTPSLPPLHCIRVYLSLIFTRPAIRCLRHLPKTPIGHLFHSPHSPDRSSFDLRALFWGRCLIIGDAPSPNYTWGERLPQPWKLSSVLSISMLCSGHRCRIFTRPKLRACVQRRVCERRDAAFKGPAVKRTRSRYSLPSALALPLSVVAIFIALPQCSPGRTGDSTWDPELGGQPLRRARDLLLDVSVWCKSWSLGMLILDPPFSIRVILGRLLSRSAHLQSCDVEIALDPPPLIPDSTASDATTIAPYSNWSDIFKGVMPFVLVSLDLSFVV